MGVSFKNKLRKIIIEDVVNSTGDPNMAVDSALYKILKEISKRDDKIFNYFKKIINQVYKVKRHKKVANLEATSNLIDEFSESAKNNLYEP